MREKRLRLHELAQYRMLVQGPQSGTDRIYDAWLRGQGAAPEDPIQVSNLVAMLGLFVSGLGVTYLPYRCLSPLVTGGTLQVVEVTLPLPPVH